MNEADESHPGPFVYQITQDEARIGGARAGFRRMLRRRFSLRHVAPLVGFVLLMAFTAILALSGLLARRAAEAILILAAITFMANRLWTHFRLRRAQTGWRDAAALGAGPVRLWLDAGAVNLETGGGARRLAYRDCREIETLEGMNYLWSAADEAALIPNRAFANEAAAAQFVALLRRRIARARKP